ncbi:MAG: AraC family transcriptional regulator [Lachnospiraceae bacterium]|nr:AraC family transcriptional regulator [Lachnospiraceae bacterium]
MNITGYEHYHEKKVHGTTDFPYITYICTIPLDFSFVPLHWHEEFEIIYIKKGRGTISVDLERYPVTAGNIVLILPGQLHSIEGVRGETMEYENIIFHLNMLMGKGADTCTRDYFKPLSQGIANFPPVITSAFAWYPAFAACIDEADEICKYYPVAYPLAIKSKLFQMFYILFYNESKPLPRTRPQKSIAKAKYILQYISEHYEEHLSIESMSEVCHLSESHFMKFFKSATGMTFTEYLNDYRLTVAARLLQSGNQTILEIASVCGFENVSYFNRLFKRKYQTTPSRYRKGR